MSLAVAPVLRSPVYQEHGHRSKVVGGNDASNA